MPTKYYLDWKEVNENWSDTDYIWIDVAILIGDVTGEILGGDYTLTLDDIDPMESLKKKLKDANVEEKKAEKFLEVIVNVKGETKKMKKEVTDNATITIKDIQNVLNKYGHSHIKVKAKIKDN
jgi:hypothetical protein